MGEPSSWVTEALARVPMPDSPIRQPWEFSASAVMGPHLRLAPKLLNRLGQIRITPHTIAVDQSTDVAWTDVVAIRTRPVLETLTAGFVEKAADRSAFLLPPIPGAKAVTARIASRAGDVLAGLVQLVAHDARSLATQVPVEIEYTVRRRTKTMTPGLLSTAALSLPPVSDSILCTAAWYGVSIVSEAPPPASLTAERAYAALQARTKSLTARLRTPNS